MCSVYYEEGMNRSAAYDGGRMVGECNFQRHGKTWVIDRTKIDDPYLTDGTGDQLLECLAKNARQQGAVVVPLAQYAATWFRRHPAYRDVL